MKKIVKVSAVITTAVVLTGCSGGSSTSNDNYYEEPTTPSNPVNPTNPEQSGYPAYYIDEELGGQRFVAEDTEWYYEEQGVKNQKFTDAYTMAQKFMSQKVTELQTAIAGQTDNDYYKMIDTALQKYNSEQNIANNVTENYKALAPVFFNFQKKFLSNYTIEDFYAYEASYYKLAHNAYQNSSSYRKNNTALKVNKQMMSDIYPDNFFAKELVKTNLSYKELTVDNAKTIMNTSLNNMANITNTDLSVLKKVIELALYNESLYGLNDFAKANNVDVQNLRWEHSISDINTYIDEYEVSNTQQNLSDRTM